ncbi:MAG: heavy-metal-associated domain-containing protein [Chitinophagales bacterium]
MKFSNILFVFLFVFSFSAFADNANGKKTIEIHVDGICEMCEKRIEDAVYKLKGIQYADWQIESKMLTVTYKSNKVSQEEIEKAIIAVGHDTENFTSPDSAYNKIHNCCKYREMDSH